MANLNELLGNIASAIRTKKGSNEKINAQDFPTEIENLPSGENTLKKLLDATKSAKYLFDGYQGTSVDGLISYNDTENVTTAYHMFSQCSSLTTIPQLNTQNVTSMSYTFSYCSNLTSVPLLNTEKVTDMSGMFNQCSSLTTIPQFNIQNVTNMYYMFASCSKLTTISLLNTQNVTNMGSMFNNCQSLTSVSLSNTQNVTSMDYMFSQCSYLQTIDITKLANSNSGMCYYCYSLTKLIIRTMDTIPSLSSNAFLNCLHFTGTTSYYYNPQGLKDGRIYVPDDKVEQLKTATNWSVYADIIVPLSTLGE